MPTVPVRPHDRQMPTQAVAQQTPCSQKFELHSPAAPHVAPIGFLPQLPPMQVFWPVQSVFAAHVVLQVPAVPQMNGSHCDGDVVWQVPVPLHVRAGE